MFRKYWAKRNLASGSKHLRIQIRTHQGPSVLLQRMMFDDGQDPYKLLLENN